MKPQRGGKPAHGEPVVDRALRVLAAFTKQNEALTLEQLSIRADLPKATTLRLARRLAAWGALERMADGTFVVGLRLLEVATLSPRGHGLRAIALPYLEDLHHATGQHVLLAVRDGRESVLVERLSAHRAGAVYYRVGARISLHITGVGQALLAYAPPELQEEVLAGDLTLPWGPDLTAAELRRTLARVRRRGIATMSTRKPEPMSSVAAPVFGSGGDAVAALSVLAPTASFRPAALAPAVIAVARAVSRACYPRSSEH
ncbi:IclR family transcriptional regulator [Amycolatopsis jejuensis]|uniref:IclR family transcriptional regulator n=1 Tax=Amycolatopsis jejuensis TaxID=330084 RepID=UPI0005269D04|nr:IclR family transcriptional regulator [Amycolatopsis jejuensis]